MSPFFKALALIVFFTSIFAGYYFARDWWMKRRKAIHAGNMQHKRYLDEKYYCREQLMNTLPALVAGDVHWLLVRSKLVPEQSVEITLNQLENNLKLIARCEYPDESGRLELKKMGLIRIDAKEDRVEFYMSPNSQILIDVLYFIFEIIYGQNKFHNISIKTSGE